MRQLDAKLQAGVSNDGGQVTIIVVLAVGLFLLLFAGFSVDMTNLFFHRQTAQNAADAACVAAGMDMLVNQTNGGSSLGGFTRGTAFDCHWKAYRPMQVRIVRGLERRDPSRRSHHGARRRQLWHPLLFLDVRGRELRIRLFSARTRERERLTISL